MDKKKVKELIDKTIRFTKATDDEYIQGNVKSHIINALQVALDELSKSDWVSVEDGLPEYMEKVWVTNKEHRDFVWISHRENGDTPKKLDDNGFPAWQHHFPYYPVTHWKPIEKLED